MILVDRKFGGVQNPQPIPTLIHALLGLSIALNAYAAQTATYTIHPAVQTPETVISGHGWAYTVPFEAENSSTIEKIIQCESQGVNIARPDSNGLLSYGILQFNGTSTWDDFSAKSDIRGSPMVPADAIRLADWAISHGYGYRWTCWHITGLDQTYGKK